MNKRNTRQKNIIYEVIIENRIHPTMLQIYDMVCRLDPSIGQATVYRCINDLVKEGKIKKLSINDGVARYDIIMDFHYHLKCSRCGKIVDLYDDRNHFINYMEKKYPIKIDTISVVVDGKCEECSHEV